MRRIVPKELSNDYEDTRIDTILDILKEYKSGIKLLDAGMGDGRIAIEKSLDGCSVVGIDNSKEQIDSAKKYQSTWKSNVRFVFGSILDIQYPSDYFDVTICCEVLEHLPESEMVDDVIAELKRVTKYNGLILITVPLENRVNGSDKHPHFNIFTKKSFDRWFYRRNEFKINTPKEVWYGFTYRNIPEISIIMPNYNHGKYVEDALNSVICQTFLDYEIIFVDDCSTDNSLEFVKKFKNIRLFLHDKNYGVCKAWNTGFKNARGKYWIVLSSDDRFYLDNLETMHKHLEDNKDVILVYGSLQPIDMKGNISGNLITLKEFDYYKLIYEGNYIGGSIMYKASELMDAKTSVGEKLLYAEPDEECACDYGLWLKFADWCLYNNKKMVSLHHPCHQYRTHPEASRYRIDRSHVRELDKIIIAKAKKRYHKQ